MAKNQVNQPPLSAKTSFLPVLGTLGPPRGPPPASVGTALAVYALYQLVCILTIWGPLGGPPTRCLGQALGSTLSDAHIHV